MTTKNSKDDKPNVFYFISVTVLTFVLPTIGFLVEYYTTETALTFELFGKWFVFSAAGLRLFLASIKQVKKSSVYSQTDFSS